MGDHKGSPGAAAGMRLENKMVSNEGTVSNPPLAAVK